MQKIKLSNYFDDGKNSAFLCRQDEDDFTYRIQHLASGITFPFIADHDVEQHGELQFFANTAHEQGNLDAKLWLARNGENDWPISIEMCRRIGKAIGFHDTVTEFWYARERMASELEEYLNSAKRQAITISVSADSEVTNSIYVFCQSNFLWFFGGEFTYAYEAMTETRATAAIHLVARRLKKRSMMLLRRSHPVKAGPVRFWASIA